MESHSVVVRRARARLRLRADLNPPWRVELTRDGGELDTVGRAELARARRPLKTKRAGPVPTPDALFENRNTLRKVLVRVGAAAGDTRTLPFLRLLALC